MTIATSRTHDELLRFSTAGSVDDGKSTLIGRLLFDAKAIFEDHLDAIDVDSKRLNRVWDLALVTDGLKSEREQGITIDVAYRYFSTPNRRFIIADTPGHEQYTRNMATGASTSDLAIIIVDAKKGITTQSKRHTFIATLMGVKHLVLAVNKMDLVNYDRDRFEDIRTEFLSFSAKFNCNDIKALPISALVGDNVVTTGKNMPWYHGETLLNYLETVSVVADRNLIDFRFPVQYVNRPTADFRGYCGTIASGSARVGREIMVMPSRKRSRIREIRFDEQTMEEAGPPQAVTITLEDELDVSRGDVLVYPENVPTVSKRLEAMVVWMSETPLDLTTKYVVKHMTNQVKGIASRLVYRVDPNTLHQHEAETLRLNEIGRVEFSFFNPLVWDEYDRNRVTGRFILIDPITNDTVAAGTIIRRSAEPTVHGHEFSRTPGERNIFWESSEVTHEDRAQFFGQKAVTLWLTGLSGSGKSTIAKALEKRLIDLGRACYVLDGDNVRHGLNRDLGFGAEDRTENVRRIGEVAGLMNQAGLIVITAFISPYQVDRDNAKQVVGEDRFFEVFINTPIEVCEMRDPKGLYKKARAGEIKQFTGISAPYEEPTHAALECNTVLESLDKTIERIVRFLMERQVIPKI